ncbi:STM4014 family protein [Paenibacillus agricola]|uniref:ATP-grasp domain-containing protein n=1 Tax=Paenibacillus agricola TaxID=2716264 RepID=A0ABX0J399_9BACL|nr:STM4014 family protein [Paenibacillus agricola]NHN30847.1 hypothetical protein [Paenibacillus agricola]
MAQRLIVVGNPGNKRTALLQQARLKLGLPEAIVISYLDCLTVEQEPAKLARILFSCCDEAGRLPMIRLDSPGENFEVEIELIALGAEDASEADGKSDTVQTSDIAEAAKATQSTVAAGCVSPALAFATDAARYQRQAHSGDAYHPLLHLSSAASISAEQARSLLPEQGRIYEPAQWFRGWCRLLQRIKQQAEAVDPFVRWMNDPAEIALMFDKRRCHQLLSAHSVPVPPLPSVIGSIRSYEQLRDAMHAKRMHRVFIKLAYGSSASGIIAYQVHPSTGAEKATTTIGIERRGNEWIYYNAGALRTYTQGEPIQQIINWLCAQGVHIERWMEKAGAGSRAFDIRQLVVGERACHRIARLSHTPITNLHLRNERADPASLGLSDEVLSAVGQAAEATMGLFKSSFVAGIDILLARGSHQPYVADINPFGDLLYEVEFNGYNTYKWEMACVHKAVGDA